jgi:hypothetical protein
MKINIFEKYKIDNPDFDIVNLFNIPCKIILKTGQSFENNHLLKIKREFFNVLVFYFKNSDGISYVNYPETDIYELIYDLDKYHSEFEISFLNPKSNDVKSLFDTCNIFLLNTSEIPFKESYNDRIHEIAKTGLGNIEIETLHYDNLGIWEINKINYDTQKQWKKV